MTEQERICRRIMDACLREDVRQLVSRGRCRHQDGQLWLELDHLAVPLRLAVSESDYMQPLRADAGHWWCLEQGRWQQESGHQRWLERLMAGLEEDEQALYSAYMDEADAAIEQGELCRRAFAEQADRLAGFDADWGARLLHADQMASFRPPLLPHGPGQVRLQPGTTQAYAPEFAPSFGCTGWPCPPIAPA
ncbi:hypothetical protein MBH78_10950 [Oceanimonas sp. NS1]|nr:hypothetical protein [Oceanimonas sp. NS1]